MPFALKVAGKTLYVLSNLADINAMYKTGNTISFEYATRQTMLAWGITHKGDEDMNRPNHQGRFPNPRRKTVGQLAHDVMRVHLEAPSGLQQLADNFEARLRKLIIRPEQLPKQCIIRNQHSGHVEVSLLGLCQQVLLIAGPDTFFGETLRSLHRKDFVETFTTFDADAWKILSQLPRWTAKDCFDCRDDMVTAMTKWLSIPRHQRAAAAPIVVDLEDEFRASGMPNEDIALMLFFMNWLFNVNTFKLSFWMTSWIISNPELHAAIKNEIISGSENGKAPSTDYFVNSCPTLNAVFDEAQRMTVAAMSTRVVLEDTVINGWLYRAGGTILASYKFLHAQTTVFGDNIDEFDHTRFLNIKNLGRNPNFKPFGGGNTLCTGRFLARREVLSFIGMLFANWDVEKISAGFPEMDSTKPGLGTMEPKAGHDVKVRLRLRSQKPPVYCVNTSGSGF